MLAIVGVSCCDERVLFDFVLVAGRKKIEVSYRSEQGKAF